MTRLQRLFRYLQKKTSCFALFLLPYYFFRFIYSSLTERSLWFYRYPMGHFGSTIPSKLDLITDEGRIFNKTVGNIPGIELNVELQLGLLSEFSKYNRSFASSKDASLRPHPRFPGKARASPRWRAPARSGACPRPPRVRRRCVRKHAMRRVRCG